MPEKLIKTADVLNLIKHFKENNSLAYLLDKNPDLADIAQKISECTDSNQVHQLHSIFNNIPVMVGLWNRDFINIYSNKRYSEYFSYTLENIKGIHIKDLLGKDLFEKNLPFMMSALEGKVQSFEREITSLSGQGEKVHVSYIPYVKDGSVDGFIAVVTDISDIKQKSQYIENRKKFYSHILNSFTEGFVVHDKNAKIIYFNKVATTILGVNEEQLLGKMSMDPAWQIIHEDGSEFPAEDRPALQTIKTGLPCKDVIMGIKITQDETRWLRVNSTPLSEEFEGHMAATLVTFVDITKQFLSEKMLSGLIHNSPGMIYKFKITNTGQMSFPFISSKGYEIYEVTKEEVEKDPHLFLNMVHPDDRVSQFRESLRASQNMTDFEWSGRIVLKDGRTKSIQVKGTPHIEFDDSVIFDGIVIDVTKEVQMKEDLENERIKSAHSAKLASLGELSAGVAHEINNPLMIISNNVQKLEGILNDPEKFKSKILKIEKSIERITKIVLGLKRFSRMEPGTDKIIIPFHKVFDDALTFIKINTTQHETELALECTTKASVLCNAIEIEQVLINLVNNALDAIKKDNKKWIKIVVEEKGRSIFVKVVDSGPGISAEVIAKIFDPFFTTKNVGEGTGLGLSISRSIIQDHGGELSYKEESKHTCFIIELPIHR